MTSTLTDAELDALIRLRAEAAPVDWDWEVDGLGDVSTRDIDGYPCVVADIPQGPRREQLAILIAAAVNAVEPMAAELLAARKRIKELEAERETNRALLSDTARYLRTRACNSAEARELLARIEAAGMGGGQ